MNSGLYSTLADRGSLVPHTEVEKRAEDAEAYRILRPERIPFISYPYEWSFSQLKDAALLTLEIQKQALAHGMSLKDASAFNIQFRDCKPVLIDSLSFERYQEGSPWVAYRQFCQHFLAPLALMSYTDVRLHQLSRLFIDGIPLDLASTLLPARTWLRFSLLTHIHMHARYQTRFAASVAGGPAKNSGIVTKQNLVALLENLTATVQGLRHRAQATEWAKYYQTTNYTDVAFMHKQEIVGRFLKDAHPRTVWDLGANTGVFSRIAAAQGACTVSFDIDPLAVEANYRRCAEQKECNILPLILDLTNPSPAIGWRHRERMSLVERKTESSTILALALIHHLAISNNVPFRDIAAFFNELGSALIIEFVPKDDSNVQRLLATRKDIFLDYTREAFEKAFRRHFTIREAVAVRGSKRVMYYMVRT
ncbi:MAG: SAM-dependent methyltransferase [Candidatus Adlerbacteria bacterium]|nr:SAM-dependent methyltransferase [Candidatus Adlerbacteria bacterium]